MRHPVALIGAAVLLLSHAFATGPTLAQDRSLSDLLPGYPEGGSTVVVTNEGSRTPAEYAAIFFDPEEAARFLAEWGCRENAFRVYEDAQPTGMGGPRPYMQVGITRFEGASGAAAALPYIIENLRPTGARREIPMPEAIGDESRQFVAEVEEGIDLVLLVRSGSLLIGISTLLADGDPRFDPVQVAEGIVQRSETPPTPTPEGMTLPQWDVAPLLDAAPPDMPACLRSADDEIFDFATLVTRFPGVPDAATRLEELGWRTGVHRQYACDPLPATGISWLDMSVHGFADEASATEAVPFFSYARTVGTQLTPAPAMRLGETSAAIAGPSENGTEYTLYVSTGRLLFRVSAVAAPESPQADVEYVMTALAMNALSADAAVPAQEHDLGVVDQATEAPTEQAEAPPSMVTPTSVQDQIDDQNNCMNTPSQCSLQDGFPDWTSPAYGCDWNYGTKRTGCVPDQQGDLDCPDLRAMELGNIRVIGDDWMLLDEDGDGFGCEYSIAAETAYCESLYEPERTACLADLDAYIDGLASDHDELNDDQYDDDYDPDPGYEQYEEDFYR